MPAEMITGQMFTNGLVEFYPQWIAEGKLPPLRNLRVVTAYRYEVRFNCLEITTVCQLTHQADYGKLEIIIVPKDWLVESKSLKEYLGAFRDKDMFQEEVVHQVAHDLWQAMLPHSLTVIGHFNNRGGIEESVKVTYPTKGMCEMIEAVAS
jgi:7-cyano-7-deazaguanine reductase